MPAREQVPLSLYPSPCLKPEGPDFREDPMSSTINMDIDLNGGYVTVEFKSRYIDFIF
jgi:hypothetical protein